MWEENGLFGPPEKTVFFWGSALKLNAGQVVPQPLPVINNSTGNKYLAAFRAQKESKVELR